jgi:hypothetical protein
VNRRSHWIAHLFAGCSSRLPIRAHDLHVFCSTNSDAANTSSQTCFLFYDLTNRCECQAKDVRHLCLSTPCRYSVLWFCQNCPIPSCQHANTNSNVGHMRRTYLLSKTICMRPIGDSAPLSTYLMRIHSPHEATTAPLSSTEVNDHCQAAALVLTFRLSTPSGRVRLSIRRSSTRSFSDQHASGLDLPVHYMYGNRIHQRSCRNPEVGLDLRSPPCSIH